MAGEGADRCAAACQREGVYLISDLGSTRGELKKAFPIVDFDSEFKDDVDNWWFTSGKDDDTEVTTPEWRPHDEGQTYACPGEPEEDFNKRMEKLYDWLSSRKEDTVALVCHWGVLDWLTGRDFENCEMQVVDFDILCAHKEAAWRAHPADILPP